MKKKREFEAEVEAAVVRAAEAEGAVVPAEPAEESAVVEAAFGVPEVDASPSYLKLEELSNEELEARRELCLSK